MTDLDSQDICLEDEVTFTFVCAGLPTPEVEWRNKGVVVNDAERYTMKSKDAFTHSLTLTDVRMEDYGTVIYYLSFHMRIT